MHHLLKPLCTIVRSCVFQAACTDIHNCAPFHGWYLMSRQNDLIHHSIIKIDIIMRNIIVVAKNLYGCKECIVNNKESVEVRTRTMLSCYVHRQTTTLCQAYSVADKFAFYFSCLLNTSCIVNHENKKTKTS